MLNVLQRASPTAQAHDVPVGAIEQVVSQMGADHPVDTGNEGCRHSCSLHNVILLPKVLVLFPPKPFTGLLPFNGVESLYRTVLTRLNPI